MIVFQWCKPQIVCFLVLAYIGIVHLIEGNNVNKRSKKSYCNHVFDTCLIVADIAIIFDGVTACTVNFLDKVPVSINLFFHMGMFILYEFFVALISYYWISVTIGFPKNRMIKFICMFPSIISQILTLVFMNELRYLEGKYTYYSMGKSVYICFGCIIFYCMVTVAVIVKNRKFIPENKKKNLYASWFMVMLILLIQVVFPQTLISCIAVTMMIIGIFLNLENPAIYGLEHYHSEMVMGFATMVENKDDNTGGHIRRSSAYAELIANNLRQNKKYKGVITNDYMRNLIQAAPMHDIGKIGIPDAILQKPGKLTNEEFDKMKEHPVIGGRIIKKTFGHLFNGEYENMAYLVAMYHHEKWNGTGYPEGISGEDIPLCARIMAVADVFDAVSAKRCYRDAMPLEECYGIIEKGRGRDFDPDIVDSFFMDKEKVEKIYHDKNHENDD